MSSTRNKSKVERCIICYDSITQSNVSSSQIVDDQVATFLIRKVLGIPNLTYEMILKEDLGTPSDWLICCCNCENIIKESQQIFTELCKYSTKFSSIKFTVEDRVLSSYTKVQKNSQIEDYQMSRRLLITNLIREEVVQRLDTLNIISELTSCRSSPPETEKSDDDSHARTIVKTEIPEITTDQDDDQAMGDYDDDNTNWSPSDETDEMECQQNIVKEEFASRDAASPEPVIKTQKLRKNFQCNICKLKFKSRIQRDGHIQKSHKGIKCTYSCTLCEDKIFSEYFLYLGHWERVHNPKKLQKITCYKCEICRKEFKLEKLLFQHHSNYHNTEELAKILIYKCTAESCNLSFGNLENLERHKEQRHDETLKFPCSHCNANFKFQCQLNDHMRTHTKVRKFSCTYCGQAYIRKPHLLYHIRGAHLKITPFKCQEPGCDKAFTDKGQLNRHMIRHTSTRQFSCTICTTASFFTHRELMVHITRCHDGGAFNESRRKKRQLEREQEKVNSM